MDTIEGYKYWKDRPKDHDRMDWRNGKDNWIAEYWESRQHPHRALIIESVIKLGAKSLLEVGCNCGPNLYNVWKYCQIPVAGIDANEDAINEAQGALPVGDLDVGNLLKLPWNDKSWDVVLSDAVLMYIPPEEIEQALAEMARVAKRAIIILDWYDDSTKGIAKDFHWARNYPRLLRKLKFKVTQQCLTEKDWPSKTWVRNGRLFIAVRP